MSTKIEWTNETWNPIVGCSRVSPGCENCYAERMANRLAGMGQEKYKTVVTDGKWNGATAFDPSVIDKPRDWKKPRMIFVCSMGDLFHELVPFSQILEVLVIAQKCPQHTFQILTKRPDRMREFFTDYVPYFIDLLPNVWIGVTAENQMRANERLPILNDIPAAVKFVSVEPMLSNVDLNRALEDTLKWHVGGLKNCISWVICGGESGPGARPLKPEWVRSLRDQCVEVDVPFFFKQWGGKNKKAAGSLLDGKEYKQFPK